MSNPRIQSTLAARVQETAKEFSCQPSTAFIIFCLQNIYGLDEIEVEEAITDGGNDKGIDAIFIQVDENGNNILYIVQSKYFAQNPNNSLDETAKTLMVETVRNYVLGDAPTNVLNPKLKPRIESARNSFQSGEIDKIKLLFLTNGKRPQASLYEELERFSNESDKQVNYEILTEKDVAELILPPSTKPVGKVSIKVVKDTGAGAKTFLDLPDINHSKGKVVRVDVFEIAKLVEDKPNIFNANVRGYLGENKINDQIKKTLLDKEAIETFIYLNNGITILCDNYQIKVGNEIVELTNPSLINGCQTASTIRDVYQLGKIEENTGHVLVRIIESSDPKLKEAIIKASNTQSTVNNRDLISEDDIQKQLEAQFNSLGYFYQRKRGLYTNDGNVKKEKIIDLEKAAQAYMSLFLERPSEAKNKKAEIYNAYYTTIFHNQISAHSLLISFKLLEWFKQKLKKNRPNYSLDELSLFSTGLLHLLTLFKLWVLIPEGIILEEMATKEGSLEKIKKEFEKNSERVMNLLSVAMATQRQDPTFNNYQYFFKSPSSLDKLRHSSFGEKLEYKSELNTSNYAKYGDLRYTKPESYSLGGQKFKEGGTWSELFVILVELYSKTFVLTESTLSFIDGGDRQLLIKDVLESSDEAKLRKKLKNGLWLLTNFDSKRLCHFCFALAKELNLQLAIKIRPTKFRLENKLS
ncbi:MAG: AIPR family protein [Minisyncoccia bacterium]|jgi:hypothetical protein